MSLPRRMPSRLLSTSTKVRPQAASFLACFSARSFHSYDHQDTSAPFNPVETAILSASYRHVPELGFTQAALTRGAADAGYSPISTTVLLDGSFSLIRYHLVTRRLALAAVAREAFGTDNAEAPPVTEAVVRDRVETLTWERLAANRDIIFKWQEALAIMAQPSYAPASFKELGLLSDEILFLAGDKSVDPSWYMKRASLSTIYASSELFMTNDHSPDFVETRNFLERRMRESNDIGGALASVRNWAGFTANAGLNVLRSKGLRI